MESEYREDHGHEINAPIVCEVVVKHEGEYFVRTIETTALSPMGVVQHQISDELNVPLSNVIPIRWKVVGRKVRR